MESEHFIGKVAQKAILVKGDMVLISRGKGDVDMWELPGGRLHRTESPVEGLKREIKEELGVDAKIGQPIYVEQFKMRNPNEPEHFFIAYEAFLVDESQPFMFDPVEVTEAKWIAKTDISSYSFYDNCKHALEAYFAEK